MIPLVAVAHGSRDPRSAATIHSLANAVRAAVPGLDVRVAFLDLSAPRVGDVLKSVHGDGYREAVLVPLLLGRAYHARVDVPAAVAEAQQRFSGLRVHVSDVLGPDERLDRAAWRRLMQTGVRPDDPELGVVLAAAGSSHAPANRLVAEVAESWQARTSWAGVAPAFAAAAEPDVPAAVDLLRARGAKRIAVGSWFLAPGLLPDRIIQLAQPHTQQIAAPMADDAGVAELVVSRYAEALAASTESAAYPAAL
ncbi:sirohydrochlorin chelatase [Saccharopolyspora rectivirgula]|jgi:sirohydrochlorin ferrochelatase|uniref:Cobalamin biosynthesis protein n=1 Tax=Saccharopolyspora rectivirgula TaxID=28042 RepID=A0A073AWQ2_9PSEU|nr:sirohydrochlorin chelatase [Saccharopolyspora rectivirgula]KEI44188.1 cobalamin biosynthesis protein [Saccharopolyspora rectivirgula]